MPYFYIVLAIIVLFAIMHKFTEFQMQQKVAITVVMTILLIAFYIYEQGNRKSSRKGLDLRYAFEQGQTLICKDREVHKDLYNYASRSFIGKKGTKMQGSPHIAISDCKIKP